MSDALWVNVEWHHPDAVAIDYSAAAASVPDRGASSPNPPAGSIRYKRIPYLSTPAVAPGFRYIGGTTDFRQKIGNGWETSGYSSSSSLHTCCSHWFWIHLRHHWFFKENREFIGNQRLQQLSDCRCGDNGSRVPHLSTPAVATGFRCIGGTAVFPKNIGNSLGIFDTPRKLACA
eukprot:gene14699-biopygen12189